MVYFKRLFLDRKRAQYEFYPERDFDHPGILDFDLGKKRWEEGAVLITDSDKYPGSRCYPGHAIRKIYEYNFPPFGNSEWY